MATIIFKSRRDLGGGNFEFTFDCLCIPRPVQEIKVIATNDGQARFFAQEQCDKFCESGETETPGGSP